MLVHLNPRRLLQPAPFVYEGLCQLFELFLLHVFADFAGVRLADLISDRALVRVRSFALPGLCMQEGLRCVSPIPVLHERHASYNQIA